MNMIERVNNAIAITKKSKLLRLDREFASTETQAQEMAAGVWLELNAFYIELNKELGSYLKRKVDEYAFLSKLDENLTNKNTYIALKETFSPVNKYYTEEIHELITTARQAIKEFNNDLQYVEPRLQPRVKEKVLASFEYAYDDIMVAEEEIEYLSPLVKGSFYRFDKKYDQASSEQTL